MSRSGRKRATLELGHDAFLDIVANLVGILLQTNLGGSLLMLRLVADSTRDFSSYFLFVENGTVLNTGGHWLRIGWILVGFVDRLIG